MKINGAKLPNDIWLLASAVDRLSILVWRQSKDGQEGKNPPELITARLIEQDSPDELMTFNSGAEFDKAWRTT